MKITIKNSLDRSCITLSFVTKSIRISSVEGNLFLDNADNEDEKIINALISLNLLKEEKLLTSDKQLEKSVYSLNSNLSIKVEP